MRRRTRTRMLAASALMATVVGSTTACGITVDTLSPILPKPGVGGDSYIINAVFENALNLPNQAHVKVGGSDVGQVTKITTQNFLADVEMKIRTDVALPKNATAELRQATPLGDVYVAMTIPENSQGEPVMQDGDTIPREQTSAGASVEDLLLSVTTLINGGALNQIAKIASELDSMVSGKAPVVSHLIVEMTNTTAALSQRTNEIDNVLQQLDSTVATLNQRRDELGNVADTVPGMISALAENNRTIGDLMAKISTASAALGDFANTSTGELSGLLDNTDKLMSNLAATGDNLTGALDGLHEIYPKTHATFQASVFAVSATATYLSIGALWDPAGSKWPGLGDVQALTGGLIDVLQRVYQRVTGAPPR